MARPTTPLVVTQFLGENDDTACIEIGETQGAIVQNMYLRRNKLVRRWGQQQTTSSLSSSQQIQGLMWCYLPPSAPVEYVLGVWNGNLYDFYNSGFGGAPTLLTGGSGRFSSSAAVNCGSAVVDNVAYWCDGTNPLVRFDGTSVKKSGSVAPATAPTLAVGAAGVLSGNYTYQVTYMDADGHESEPSPASAVLNVTSQQIVVTLPTTPTDTDSANKRIYRVGGSTASYRLVATVARGTTTYTDNVADSVLGALLIIGNTQFPPCQILWEHDSRLWGVVNNAANDKQTIYISNYLAPWYCPLSPNLEDPNQGIRLRIQSRAGSVIGGISYGGYSIIFTGTAGYLVEGIEVNSYNVQKFTNHGAVSHRCLATVRNLLIWLGPDGVYAWDGISVERISQDEWEFTNALSAGDMDAAVAWVWEDRYYLSTPSGTRYYDTKYKYWGRLTNNNWAAVTSTVFANFGRLRLFGVPRGKGGVLQFEVQAATTDTDLSGAATNIACRWKSRIWDMGEQSRDKRLHLFGVKTKAGTGTATIAVSPGAGDAVQTENFDTATTDDAAYTAANPLVTVCRREAVEQLRSEYFQMDVQHQANSADFQLLQAEMHWTLAG